MSVQLPRLQRVGNGRERGVEVRVRDAPALARPAVVARCRPLIGFVMFAERPIVIVRPSFVLHARAELRLGARHRHRGMELAVGQLGHVLGLALDADVVLDDVVVRREVVVVERPVLAVAVERLALQVLLAEAIALAPPHVGAAADDAQAALPGERLVRRRRVRLLEIVGEPAVVVFHARVAVLLARARAADQIVAPCRGTSDRTGSCAR